MKKPIKYFVYARRSSDDGIKQLNSISTQLAIIEPLMLSNKVVDELTESRSALIPNNRPKFREMINRILKGEASGIICVNIDRLSRNPLESGELQYLLQQGIIESILTPHKEYLPADNAILISIETSAANQSSRDLSVKVKNSQITKIATGQPPGVARIGYLNTKSAIKGTNKIIKDPERWDIVRKGFDLMLTGKYSVHQVQNILNNDFGLRTRKTNKRGGVPITISGLYRMFTEPYYYGYFVWSGRLHKGAYEPLITVEEFDHIQMLLGRKGRSRSRKHNSTYAGLMTCGECGSAITCSNKTKFIKKSREFKTYALYHCTHRKTGAQTCSQRLCLSMDKIEKLMVGEMEQYDISTPFVLWSLDLLKKIHLDEINKEKELEAVRIKNQIRLKKEIDNLLELRIAGEITKEEFGAKKIIRENQLQHLYAHKSVLLENLQNPLLRIEKGFGYVNNVIERFKKAEPDIRKEICFNFGSNWILSNQKLIFPNEKWLIPFKNFKNSITAEFGTFEPNSTLNLEEENAIKHKLLPVLGALVNEVRTEMANKFNEL